MTSSVRGREQTNKGNKTRKAVKRLQNKPQQVVEPLKGIVIGRNWRVGADSLNIILYRRQVNKKTGQEYWRARSYYSNVANALIALVDQGVRDTELADLKTVCDKIDQLRRDILEGFHKAEKYRNGTLKNKRITVTSQVKRELARVPTIEEDGFG